MIFCGMMTFNIMTILSLMMGSDNWVEIIMPKKNAEKFQILGHIHSSHIPVLVRWKQRAQNKFG
jgi:hypothetical protein